jgi:phosphoribosyl-ATP pyrophosphohydrolase
MISPDFIKKPVYDLKIYDEKNILIYSGFINSKAWFKTIETNEIWEYLPENARVISKDFENHQIDLAVTNIDKNNIEFHLIKNKSFEKSTKNKLNDNSDSILLKLEKIILQRKKEMPPNSYTTHLFEKGEEKILKKLGEEAIELILASKAGKEEIIYETSDLIYHILVYLSFKEIDVKEILFDLQKRMEK